MRIAPAFVLALAAALVAGSALAQSAPGASEGIRAPATVNSIEGGTVNVTHGPIAEIGWPSMTMDLELLEGAEGGAVAAGDEATMVLEKGPDGLYGIRALMPAE